MFLMIVKTIFVCIQPKFLTKEERAMEALKRRQEEIEAKRKIADEEKKKQLAFLSSARESGKCHV